LLARLKREAEKLLKPLLALLSKLNVKPIHLTLLSFAMATCYLILSLFLKDYLLMALFLTLSSLMDGLDGALARYLGESSDLGSLIDSVTDRFSDAFLILGLYFSSLINSLETLAALFAFLMISYLRAKGESLGVKMEGVGLAERGERILMLLLVLLTATTAILVSKAIFYTLLGLSYLTIVQRIRKGVKELKGRLSREAKALNPNY